MTDVITFRPRRPKQALQRRFGNVSEKLNDLLEHELAREATDWRVVLDQKRPRVSDDAYAQCLKPE
jgi:hypothetical protein